ncbi:hypothetical protein D932_02888 [Enterococcus casseliflavus 14-MB-W-14]|jgi:hypothetical protein|nr:hypothetical protein CO692_11085 [Enterococcus sp. FDAARGOS_375]AYJ43644.1 hypothetical protein D8N35_00440 [Enterococcus casseliflavus]EPH61394.1 hypothetical protein D932_02888 [Enterococcus casseliflavus 14-MB-W-14]HCO72802.1 hypothetical protein [Enterococcus sp.]MBE6170247.1 hypothetical protein [Enterococcus casseliflavus]
MWPLKALIERDNNIVSLAFLNKNPVTFCLTIVIMKNISETFLQYCNVILLLVPDSGTNNQKRGFFI